MTNLVARNVCGLLSVDADELLAVGRRKNPGFFGLPGGKVDPGETPRDALKREFLEETGLEVVVAGTPLYEAADETGEVSATYVVELLTPLPSRDFTGPEGTPVKVVPWSLLTSASTCEFCQYNLAVKTEQSRMALANK